MEVCARNFRIFLICLIIILFLRLTNKLFSWKNKGVGNLIRLFGNNTNSHWGSNTAPSNWIANPQLTGKQHADGPPTQAVASTRDPQCFKYGETGHRMSYFRKGHRLGKNLSVENEDVGEEPYVDLEQEAAYDTLWDDNSPKYVKGDRRPLLVVWQAYLTPRMEEGGGNRTIAITEDVILGA